MSQQVAKLMLFTLSACPMGRSIQTVLSEVLTVKKDIGYAFTPHIHINEANSPLQIGLFFIKSFRFLYYPHS